MSHRRVDVRTMELQTDPLWSPLVTFAMNLLAVNGHAHGNKRYYKGEGPLFIPFDDAVELMARVLTHHGLRTKGDASV